MQVPTTTETSDSFLFTSLDDLLTFLIPHTGTLEKKLLIFIFTVLQIIFNDNFVFGLRRTLHFGDESIITI
jgi:hypothetical protein